jgi:hypothetical protein
MPGEYAQIDRAWTTGDVIQVALPMRLSLENLHGNDRYVAVLYGPIVLSGPLGLGGGLTKADFWQISRTIPNKIVAENTVPAIVTDDVSSILSHVVQVPDHPLTFHVQGLTRPADVELIPFFRNHFQRYAIYWPRLTVEQWDQIEKRAAAEKAQLADADSRMIDRVRIGDEISEREHHLKGNQTETGTGAYDRAVESHWRDAHDGGWFSYELKVDPTRRNVLRLTFWGQERGPRTFDVSVNGHTMKTISLGDTGRQDFVNQDMSLPVDLIEGNATITVRLQAHGGNFAGGLFDLRIMPDR